MCKKIGLVYLSLLLPCMCIAEVENVTIFWNPVMCDEKCARAIHQQFYALESVGDVRINTNTGVANLRWNPQLPFSYAPIKTAMQMIGAGVNDIRVRVRGKIRAEGPEMALYSLGDNTRFSIVSPLYPDPQRPIAKPHPSLREISPTFRDRLLRESEGDKVVVVEGQLYRPAISPPLMIVVERVRVEEEAQTQKRQQR